MTLITKLIPMKIFTIKTTTFILLLFLGFAKIASAQVSISGTVTASDTKETLPGATIFVKGTSSGTVTNIDGKYTINVKSGTTLVFSFLGYTLKEVEVGTQTLINVVLDPKKTTLDEIVVIGYGTVKKSDLTGSVGIIKSDDITKITSINPVQSLQGQVTGVQVTNVSGTPGESPVVRIRGTGTFNNSQPIYVVDGVILDDISFLNCADIKSMEILKDASATAIYGSRGANGVILVSTKGGKIGEEKATFSVTGEFGIQRLARKIDLLNGKDYAIIRNRIKPGTYNNVDAVPNTDWQDLVYHIAPIYNFHVSASGSTKATQYYIGVGYFGQQGIIDKSNYQRVSLQLNNIYNLSKYIRIGNNITISPYSQEIAPDVTYAAYRAQPLLNPYYSNGDFGVVYNVGNPLASINYSNNYSKGIRGVGNLFAEANFLKSFVFKSSFGVDAGYSKSKNFIPAYTVYNPDGTASQQSFPNSKLYKGSSDNASWIWENTLTYQKEVRKHSINAVAGYTMEDHTSEYFKIPGMNIIRDGSNFWYINRNYLLNTYTDIENSVNADEYYAMISYLLRVNYVFNKKYILTLTFRSDGSSKFGTNNRWGYFPSIAAGWNLSQEKFMQNIKFLSRVKLRGSWGKIGNEKIPYLGRYSIVSPDLITIFGVNPVSNPGATYTQLGNPDLKWEVTTQTDAGLEFGLLRDRLTAEVDYYHRLTNDILVPLSVPGYFGNGQGQLEFFNAGKVLNRGFEFNIGWRDHIGPVKYGVGILGTTVHNEVLAIGGNSGVDSVLIGGYLPNGIPVTRSKVGLPIGAFYGYKTNGVFQTQAELDAYPHMSDAGIGDLRFVDVNNDGIIDGRDRTYLGSPIPTFIYGFNLDLEYKGFDFSLNISGQTGNKIFNAKDVVRPDPYNYEQYVMNSWNGAGSSNTIPRPSIGGYNYTPSDFFVLNGSFLRIRSLVLGYTLPSKLSAKLSMTKLRFYLKTDNLVTWTKYTGYTPEIGSSNSLNNGIDYGIYPVSAVYSFGINLTF